MHSAWGEGLSPPASNQIYIMFTMQEVASRATRRLILEDGYRVDGRGVTDVRAIWSRAGCLPRAHGSALFTRGETQALAVTTLGMVAYPSPGNCAVLVYRCRAWPFEQATILTVAPHFCNNMAVTCRAITCARFGC